MTKNLAIVGVNRRTGSTNITASSAQPGAEAAYLNDLRRFFPWKTVEGVVSGVDLILDFGSAISLDSLVLGGTNFGLSATAALLVGNDPTFTTNVWTVATGPAFDASLPTLTDWKQPWGRDVIFTRAAGPVTAQYAKLTLSDPTNPDGYLSADWHVPDVAWQPVRNYKVGNDSPRKDVFAGNEGAVQILRAPSFSLPALTEDEESELASLVRDLKNMGRVYVIPSPLHPETNLRDSCLCTFTEAAEFQGVDKGRRWRGVSLKFQEVDI
jgi:hypothetical protein